MKEYMQISVFGDLVDVVDLGFYNSCLSNYVIDKNGHVYSNRRFRQYARIGSRDRYGREKIVVNGIPFFCRELLRLAIPRFNSVKVDARENTPGVFKKCVVGTIRNGGLSFSSSPKLHDSRKSAEDEALRLAQSQPGTRFAVCEVVSTVCVGDVSWEKA